MGATLARVVVGNPLPGAGEQIFFLRRAVGHSIPIAVGVVQVHVQLAHLLVMMSPEPPPRTQEKHRKRFDTVWASNSNTE
jgi:hypothetical protein